MAFAYYDMPRAMRGQNIGVAQPQKPDWELCAMIGLPILLVMSILAAIFWVQASDKARIAKADAGSLYQVGQVVKSRIGGFRGIVTSKYCYDVCHYTVRFNVASMEPQSMAEYEIEASQ